MADDDDVTRERQRLLDEVEDANDLLARLGVATRLPMSVALRCTTAQLHHEAAANWRHYLDMRRQLDGLA